MQQLLELHELRHLAFHEPRDGHAGPLGDDLGDVFGVDLFLQHRGVALQVGEPGGAGLDLALQHRQVPVTDLGGTLQVALALGLLGLELHRLEPLLVGADRGDGLLLGAPVRDHPVALLAERRELLFQCCEPALAGVVALLAQRGALDLELADAALDDIDLERHRVDLDAQARRGLVDEVDRLVGQAAARDVAPR